MFPGYLRLHTIIMIFGTLSDLYLAILGVTASLVLHVQQPPVTTT
jgi:hypothetical protein